MKEISRTIVDGIEIVEGIAGEWQGLAIIERHRTTHVNGMRGITFVERTVSGNRQQRRAFAKWDRLAKSAQ